MQHLPYWRLSSFYFIYFTFVGAFSPYWSLYLKSLDFTAFQIGVLMSLFHGARIVAPNLWGWLADHSGVRVRIIQVSVAASLLCYLGVFFGESYAWLFGVMTVMSFFWSAPMPVAEALTLTHLGARSERYGTIRLWGSIGFIASVVGLGYVLDIAPVRTLLWVILGLKVGVLAATCWIPEPRSTPHPPATVPAWHILRRPEVSGFMLSCFLMSLAHGVYYTFYSIYLVDHGYSKGALGWLWALGVICEVLVFIWMPQLTRRFGLRRILLGSFALAGLRFGMIGWGVDSMLVLLLAQTLHAASFGAFHAASVAVTHRFFTHRHQAKGQAFYTSISFGLGGTLGGLLSGMLWDVLTPAWTFTLSGGFALAGMLVIARRLKLSE